MSSQIGEMIREETARYNAADARMVTGRTRIGPCVVSVMREVVVRVLRDMDANHKTTVAQIEARLKELCREN